MRIPTTNEGHPLLDILDVLLPKSENSTTLTDNDAPTPSLSVQHRATQIKLCCVLVNLVNHPRMADTLMDNNSLQVLIDASEGLPTEQEDTSEFLSSDQNYYISQSISYYLKAVRPSGRRSEEHLKYILGHLVGICVFTLVANARDVEKALLSRVVAWRPLPPRYSVEEFRCIGFAAASSPICQ